MERVPLFNLQQLTSIAKILAETNTGLTGTQLENLLRDCRIPDVTPDQTKWKRLLNAFIAFQNKRQFGNHVVVFINKAMNPVQYTTTADVFDSRRDELNIALAFCGMWVGEDGQVRKGTIA